MKKTFTKEIQIPKELSLISILKLFNIFMKLRKLNNTSYIKIFIKEYYCLEEDMPEDFYNLLLNQMQQETYLSLFNITIKRNIYLLISHLTYNQENIPQLKQTITPLQYYNTPKKHINKIIEALKELKNNKNPLDKSLNDEAIWLLKREPSFSESEYIIIAYKIIHSIGLDNGLELLSGKYGEINYKQIHFLFSKLNIKKKLPR